MHKDDRDGQQQDTAILEAWITCASTPRASSQRANQKPSRPASKASAIRVIAASTALRAVRRSTAAGLSAADFARAARSSWAFFASAAALRRSAKLVFLDLFISIPIRSREAAPDARDRWFQISSRPAYSRAWTKPRLERVGPLRPKGNAVAVAHPASVVSLTGDRETLWGGRRGNGNFVAGCNRWSAAMPQPNAVAENGDQFALIPRLHPQHAEPVLLVVEGDALHQATEDLGRCAWLAAPWWRFDPSATYHACEPRHRSVRPGSGLLGSSQWECSARWYFRKGRATRLE